jgi:hypothetical protein
MVSSGRQAIASILLILGIAVYSQAQTNPPKEPTASISGKVTIKGKAAPGILVIASDPDFYNPWAKARYRATTDSSGNYTLANLPAGKYRVAPYAMAYAVENEEGSTLTIAEGETIENINFVLIRGGVITGKITDSDDQPVIEQFVNLTLLNDQRQMVRTNELSSNRYTSDDRGIYRLFGLRPGKYKVYVDDGYPRVLGTFHPSTTDESKATVIEVSEGSEIKDVDIVLAKRVSSGFKVTGQVIDGETGKPVGNISYGVSQSFDDGGTSTSGGNRTNANGDFTLENLSPGKYAVFVEPHFETEVRADPVAFEVTDRDITGLVVKTKRGAMLSGVVVLDGFDEAARKKLGQLRIHAYVEAADPHSNYANGATVQPDGSFAIKGLRSGTARLSVSSMAGPSKGLAIIRVERDGVVQPSGIDIKDTEHVTGVRLTLKQFTGAIRGEVKVEDGELPPFSQLTLSVSFLDGTPTRVYGSDPIDSRGRFLLEGLAPGRYEVRVNLVVAGRWQKPSSGSKKEVLVADNTVSEVVLTVKGKPDTDDDDDP